jgi:hypothetical protein
MNMGYKMNCVLEVCINNKVVPEIHFVALVKLKAPAHIILVECTLVLNPWCFGARVVYVRTPGAHPSHCKAIHDSQSVLPKLEKVKKLTVIYSTSQIISPPSQLVTHLCKCHYVLQSLPRALSHIRHVHKWSTSCEGGGSKSL